MLATRRISLVVAALMASSQAVGGAPREEELSLADLLELDVVTASKEVEAIQDAPGSMSVLTRDEIERLGPSTLRQLLLTMPGLSVGGGYLYERYGLAMQGDMSKTTSSHILLLVDGRPVRETMEGGLSSDILQGFPVSAIERIEVIKGPGSVLYGSDAFTGVVNIITRKPAGKAAMASAMGGSGWSRRADGSIAVVAGELEILQAATYERGPSLDADYLYKVPATGEVRVLPIHSMPGSHGAHTRVGYRDLGVFAGYAQVSSFSHVRGMINHTVQEKAYGGVDYSLRLSDWWTLQANCGGTHAELKADNFPYSQRNSYELVTEATSLMHLGEGRVVVGGVVSYREGEERDWSADRTMSDASFTGWGGYTQVSYPILPMASMVGGIQYNQVEDLEPAISPRAGVVVHLGDAWDVKAFWTNAFRAPSLNELAIDAPSQKGNLDLDPETIETWDGSVSFTGRNLYIAGNVFYSRLRGIIQALPTSDPVPGMTSPILRYRNAHDLGIVGAGCEFKDYLTPEWLLSGSYNYQESFDDQTWDLLPVPLHIGRLGASYRSPNDWEAGIFSVYAGEYAERFAEGRLNPAPEANLQADINGRVGLSRWFGATHGGGVSLRLQVKNLFDERTSIPEWGGTTQDALPDLRGRIVYAGLELRV